MMCSAWKRRIFLVGILTACITAALSIIYHKGVSLKKGMRKGLLKETHVAITIPLQSSVLEAKTSSIFGTIKDEKGKPIRGGFLEAALSLSSASEQYEVRARASKDGVYKITGLILGREYKLAASAPGYISSSPLEIQVTDFPQEVNFVLVSEKLPDEQVTLPEEAEVESILTKTLASIERIHSGRFVYKSVLMSPKSMTREQYDNAVKTHTEFLRKLGHDEEYIREEMNKRRTEWESRFGDTGYFYFAYQGEYIFEGDSSYISIATSSDPSVFDSVYEADSRAILFHTDVETDRIEAEIFRGRSVHRKDLQSPIHSIKHIIDLLRERDIWHLKGTIADQQGLIYELKRPQYPREGYNSFLNVIPEKGFIVKSYGWSNEAGARTEISFDNFIWNSDTELFFPMRIIENRESNGKISSRCTIDFSEVEINKKYDATLFKPTFLEGTNIVDHRFDPPMRFTYQYPELLDEYLKELDQKVEAFKEKQEYLRLK